MKTYSTLGEIVQKHGGLIQTGPFGSQLHESDYQENGVPVVMPTDINNGRIDESAIARISEVKASQLSRHKLRVNMIVYPRRGEITKCAFVELSQDGYICGTGCIKIELPNDVIYPEFFYYYLNSREVTGWLKNNAVGSTMLNLSAGIFRRIQVPDIDFTTQKNISAILSNYVQLIDTNRRRIQLLEEAARFLFREWFVYFRFPHLRQGYGGQTGHEKVKILDCDGRKMPAGWDYLPFTKIKLFKKAPLGVPVFTDIRQYCQTSEIDGTSITGNGEEVDYENRPSRADIAPRINTVYFAKMKDTDKVLYFNKGNSYLLENLLLSTGMVGFTTDEQYLGFLFGLLTSYEFVQYKNNFATGATQVSLNTASLKKIKVLFPTLNLVELYSEIVNPLLEECSLLRNQNQKLAQARDLLLPRLMSGSIGV